MAFRKIRAKKYNGITEYFNPKSVNKETRSLYLSYRDETGKPTLVKSGTLDRDEALHQLNNIKAEVLKRKQEIDGDADRLSRAAKTKTLTLQQASDIYYSTKQHNKSHILVKTNMEKRVLDTWLGSKRISKISTDDIKKLQDSLKNKYAPKTVNEQIRSLRSLFTYAIKENWIVKNPVDVPKVEDDKDPGRVLSKEELGLMFKVFKEGDYEKSILANPRLYFFTKLLLHTGARPAALLDVQVKHIDFNQRKIRFKAMKKGKSYQQALTPEAESLIMEWIEGRRLTHSNYLFHNPTNKNKALQYNTLSKTSRPIFNKLFNGGIPKDDRMHRVTFYSLRRTGGTMMYKKHGIMHAMVFLNHTSVQTTQTYLNVEADIGEAVNDVF